MASNLIWNVDILRKVSMELSENAWTEHVFFFVVAIRFLDVDLHPMNRYT